MSTVVEAEIARYVEAVRAALADLPQRTRDELLEDLPDHLAEVAAEGQGSLEARLGPPAAYAVELRASAGLTGAVPARERLAERLVAVLSEARRRLRKADVAIGPLLGYATAGEFLRYLRPGWWLLRGYAAAMAVTWLLNDNSNELGLLPRLGGSDAAALVILCAFVLGSIWLGQRADRLTRWPRRLVFAGSALAVLFALVGFVEADQRARWEPDYETVVYDGPGRNIGDIFVYDSDGRLLNDVRLFDQYGRPLEVSWDGYCDDRGTEFPPQVGVYPRCVSNAPFGPRPSSTPSDPSPLPSPTPAGTSPAPPATGR